MWLLKNTPSSKMNGLYTTRRLFFLIPLFISEVKERAQL